MRHFYAKYDDYSSFLKHAFKESFSSQKESRSNDDLEWHGGVTWEQACSLAKSGWIEGMQMIENYRSRITPKLTNSIVRPVPVDNIHGFAVNVGAFLSNMPECFFDREYEKRNYPGRLFTLVVSCSYSSNVSTDVVIERGSMVCSLVDALEFAGNRVEVICNETTTDGHDKYKNEIDMVIKKHDQALDMSRLAFCLAHPAMLRRIIFSVNELSGWADISSVYGYPAEATNRGDLYIDEIHSGKISEDDALAWLTEKLKSFGVEME